MFLVVVKSDHGKRIGVDEEKCGEVQGQVNEGEDIGAAVQAACAEHGIPAFNNDMDQYVGPAEL